MNVNKGDGTIVEAEEVLPIDMHERWSSITLANGDTIRMRPAVTQVFAVKGQRDPDGNQLYIVRSQNLMVVQQQATGLAPQKEETA